MALIQFENDIVSVAYATKKDGDFGIRNNLQNPPEKKNLHRLLQTLAISKLSILYPRGDVILFSENGHEGESVLAQGVVSTYKSGGLSFGLPSSDCPTLVVINPKSGSIGLLHLSWWQLYRNLVKGFFKGWQNVEPHSAPDTHIFIGPSICANCFILKGWRGWIRIVLFSLSPWRRNLRKIPAGMTLDLRGIINDQLKALGFVDSQIHFFPDCTFEHEYLSSLRREGAKRSSSNLVVVTMK